MKNRLALSLCLVTLLCQSLAAFAQPATPLRLGIMPFNSTLALIKTHQPLRLHLQHSLGRPVAIYTAADYRAFLQESMAGSYDLLITGPHFGAMNLDHGYIPLVHYQTRLTPIFVVARDSRIEGHADMRGKRIGLSNQLSVSSIVGLQWLRDKGLEAGEDFQVLEKTTHGAAIAGVAVGDLDAALTTFTPLKQVPADVRAAVKVVATDVSVPHLMTLARPDLEATLTTRIRAALMAFPATPEGQAFFADTGYLGYQAIDAADVEALRPYVPIVRRLMQQ